MSGVALVLHQFRYDQKVFWRNPAAVFFTVLFPLIFLFIFASVFGNADDRRASGVKDDDLLRAGDHHPRGDLGDDGQAGDQPAPPTRGRAPQAGPRHAAAAWVFVAGRVGNSLVISADHGRPGQRDRRARLRRRRSPGTRCRRCSSRSRSAPPPSAASASRSPRSIPTRGRRPGRSPTRSSSRSTSSRASSSPRTRFPTASSTSPTSSRSATSSRRSSPPGTRTRRAPGFEWGHLAVVAAWGLAGLVARGPLLPLGAATLTPAGPPV